MNSIVHLALTLLQCCERRKLALIVLGVFLVACCQRKAEVTEESHPSGEGTAQFVIHYRGEDLSMERFQEIRAEESAEHQMWLMTIEEFPRGAVDQPENEGRWLSLIAVLHRSPATAPWATCWWWAGRRRLVANHGGAGTFPGAGNPR